MNLKLRHCFYKCYFCLQARHSSLKWVVIAECLSFFIFFSSLQILGLVSLKLEQGTIVPLFGSQHLSNFLWHWQDFKLIYAIKSTHLDSLRLQRQKFELSFGEELQCHYFILPEWKRHRNGFIPLICFEVEEYFQERVFNVIRCCSFQLPMLPNQFPQKVFQFMAFLLPLVLVQRILLLPMSSLSFDF